MKEIEGFKVITPELMGNYVPGTPLVSFSKHGAVSFSGQLARDMGLQKGDNVVFMQSEKKPEDWLVVKDNKAKDGFKLRGYKAYKGTTLLAFNKKLLVLKVAESLNLRTFKRFTIAAYASDRYGKEVFELVTRKAIVREQ